MQWNWHAGAMYIYNEWDSVSFSMYWRSNRNTLFSWQQYLVASFSKKWLGGSPWRELSLSVFVRHITKWAVASVSDVWVTLLSLSTLLPPYLRRLSHTPPIEATTVLGQFRWNDWCTLYSTGQHNGRWDICGKNLKQRCQTLWRKKVNIVIVAFSTKTHFRVKL